MSVPEAPPTNGKYNRDHFDPIDLASRLVDYSAHAPGPGEQAPSFSLRDTTGREWRLDELLDRPVVLVTGSASCPMTRGSMPALKDVYGDFSDRVHWFTLYVREAHPGEKLPAHESYAQKVDHAEFLQRAELVPWPILVDDLEGSVHEVYGQLPNSVFVIGKDGLIAFRERMAHGPTLRRALEALLGNEGRGTVLGGDDGMLHVLGTFTFGWKAITRAGNSAVRDVTSKLPPMAADLWIGEKVSPALRPLARRSRRLPGGTRAGLWAAVAALASLGIWSAIRSRV